MMPEDRPIEKKAPEFGGGGSCGLTHLMVWSAIFRGLMRMIQKIKIRILGR